eukprot:1153806-Pelagomonas_calceolata.AAC.3
MDLIEAHRDTALKACTCLVCWLLLPGPARPHSSHGLCVSIHLPAPIDVDTAPRAYAPTQHPRA